MSKNAPEVSGKADFEVFRRAVRLRDLCREAAMADADRLGIPLSAVQANVAYDAMVDLIRAAMAEQKSTP